MPGRLNKDVLVRFDELLAALERCDGPGERAQFITRFALDEVVFIEQEEIEFLRARDQISDDELIARVRAAPDMGGATLVDMMKGSVAERNAAAEHERGEDYRSALFLAILVFLSVVQGVFALLEVRGGGNAAKVAALAVGTLASVGLGAFIGVSWLRDLRKHSEVHEHRSWKDAAFDDSNERDAARAELERIDISAAHLRMSDALLNDASSGMLSPRGCLDSALDSGYFALLSVLTEEERRACEHPSAEAVEIAARRLGIDAKESVEFMRHRYSGEDVLSLAEVVEWAERVRGRVEEWGREVGLR